MHPYFPACTCRPSGKVSSYWRDESLVLSSGVAAAGLLPYAFRFASSKHAPMAIVDMSIHTLTPRPRASSSHTHPCSRAFHPSLCVKTCSQCIETRGGSARIVLALLNTLCPSLCSERRAELVLCQAAQHNILSRGNRR